MFNAGTARGAKGGKVTAIIFMYEKSRPVFRSEKNRPALWSLFDFRVLTSMDTCGKRSFETEGQNAPKPAWLLRKLG